MHTRGGRPAGVTSRAVPTLRARGCLAVLALGLTLACALPETGPKLPVQSGTARSFTEIRQQILEPRCATTACHAGSPPPASPLLEGDGAWGAIVGAPSGETGLNLVEPYDPSRSYLVMKLRGTGGDAGGIATPMPIGEAALDEADIAAIEAWIASGAPND